MIDAHQIITDQIIAAIESGKDGSNWAMPWHNNMASGFPVNIASQNDYQGINVFALWGRASVQGYSSNVWGTYKQWQAADCQVKKESKAARVIKVLTFENKGKEGQPDKKGFGLRAYAVFNADQVTGYEAPQDIEIIPESQRKTDLETFATRTNADISHGGNRAFYMPSQHRIQMPNFTQFKTWQDYYSTLCHELTHWTAKLVERDTGSHSNKSEYAFEELVAELGSAFLCAKLGISNEPRDDHAEYIASWLKALKSDKKHIFKASKLAQTAVEFLMKTHTAAIAA